MKKPLKRIEALAAYKPPLTGRLAYDGLLLDFNESTLPTPPHVLDALMAELKRKNLQTYPDYFGLEAEIAEYAGVEPGEVMVTNGSDQGIDLILRTFSERGDRVIIPEPSFVMYRHFAQIVGSDIFAPLYAGRDLDYPLAAVLDAIDAKTSLVVVCNPNNPTGSVVAVGDIAKLAQKAVNGLVYVDEAYFEFSKITAAHLIRDYPNIVITRTFSKAFGLASLRIGYCIAREPLIRQLAKVRGPYAVNILAYHAARAALANRQKMDEYVADVMDSAKPLVGRFFDRIGVTRFASAGNFILVRPRNAEQVAKQLADSGLLVRPRNGPGIEDTLRVSIGTTEQMAHFIQTYEKVVEDG